MLDSSDEKDLKREHKEQSTDMATAHTVVHGLRTPGFLDDPSSTRSTATTAAAATSTSSSSVSGSGASATAVTVPKETGSAKAVAKSALSAKKKKGGVHYGPKKMYEPMIEVAKSMMPNIAGAWLEPYTGKCKSSKSATPRRRHLGAKPFTSLTRRRNQEVRWHYDRVCVGRGNITPLQRKSPVRTTSTQRCRSREFGSRSSFLWTDFVARQQTCSCCSL